MVAFRLLSTIESSDDMARLPEDGEVVFLLLVLGIPFRFSDTPASVRRPPPTLGQHTGEILRDMLKLSPSRVAELRATKVI